LRRCGCRHGASRCLIAFRACRSPRAIAQFRHFKHPFATGAGFTDAHLPGSGRKLEHLDRNIPIPRRQLHAESAVLTGISNNFAIALPGRNHRPRHSLIGGPHRPAISRRVQRFRPKGGNQDRQNGAKKPAVLHKRKNSSTRKL
jgi:hypothetical protein